MVALPIYLRTQVVVGWCHRFICSLGRGDFNPKFRGHKCQAKSSSSRNVADRSWLEFVRRCLSPKTTGQSAIWTFSHHHAQPNLDRVDFRRGEKVQDLIPDYFLRLLD